MGWKIISDSDEEENAFSQGEGSVDYYTAVDYVLYWH
jgi:hypothetical protein